MEVVRVAEKVFGWVAREAEWLWTVAEMKGEVQVLVKAWEGQMVRARLALELVEWWEVAMALVALRAGEGL